MSIDKRRAKKKAAELAERLSNQQKKLESSGQGITYVLDEYGTVSSSWPSTVDEIRRVYALTTSQTPASPAMKTRKTTPASPKKTSRGAPKVSRTTTSKLGPFPLVKKESSKPNKESSKPNYDMRCPTCGVKLKAKNLNRHLRKIHGERAATSIPAPVPREKRVPKPVGQTMSGVDSIQVQRQQKDALRQDDYESRFGDKFVGYMSRESDGRFGSIPLYDDYGDEADAD